MIPKQLQRDEINLVFIEKGGKRPFQKGWQHKQIKFNDKELLQHLKDGGNYGVLGGGVNNLVLIDFDNEELQQDLVPKLPKTFTVKTGRGFLHKYFFSDKSDSFKIFDEDMDTLADVQGIGKQVVGANSVHPNGNKYLVVDESEIAFIPYAELKALLMPYDKKPIKEKKVKPLKELTYSNESSNFIGVVKSMVSMNDLLNVVGVDTSKNPTNCPFHDSEGGKCLGFNDETWHCFHCDQSGNIFSMITLLKKLNFNEALLWFANEFNLKKEYDDCKKQYLSSLVDKEKDYLREVKFRYMELVFGDKKKWPEATELLTSVVLNQFNVYTTKDDLKSEVWVYSDGIYVPQGRSQIKEFLRELLEEYYSIFVFNKVMEKIEPDTFISAEEFFFNNSVDEIPVLNGVLNIKTCELSSFSPKKVFFSKLPVTFDPLAECPAIDLFLSQVLRSVDDVKVFYELSGFSLLKDYCFEKAFMFVGDGRNGKSKCLELLKRFVGDNNVCGVPLCDLRADSFSVSELFGKLVNLAGDISNSDLKDTGMFKQLTGRDVISAKRKFMRDLHFVNHAKFVFACNNLPMVYDFSRGFWDRWVLLDFPFTFVGQAELDSREDKTGYKLKDVNVISKLVVPGELSGLLNRALSSLDLALVNNGFSYALGCDEVKSQWIMRSNSFIAFCYDSLESSGDGWVSKKDLRKAYADYCHKFSVVSKSDYVIKRVLGDLFGVTDGTVNFDGQYDSVWNGIKFKVVADTDEVVEVVDVSVGSVVDSVKVLIDGGYSGEVGLVEMMVTNKLVDDDDAARCLLQSLCRDGSIAEVKAGKYAVIK